MYLKKAGDRAHEKVLKKTPCLSQREEDIFTKCIDIIQKKKNKAIKVFIREILAKSECEETQIFLSGCEKKIFRAAAWLAF